MIVVTSWDDGYLADMKVADLLDRHGLTGTFFVPIKNSEGRPVVDKVALREIDTRFEVGSHTRNHVRLNTIDNNRIDEEIRGGKMGLEEILGHSVEGFCYPGGRVTSYAAESLCKNGIRYARTVENFRLNVGKDRYRIPTTLQIFQHRKQAYVQNFLRRGNRKRRLGCFWRTMIGGSLWDTLDSIAEVCADQDGVLHLWGHSWEIENFDLWRDLDAYLSRLKQFAPIPKTVAESIDHNGYGPYT